MWETSMSELRSQIISLMFSLCPNLSNAVPTIAICTPQVHQWYCLMCKTSTKIKCNSTGGQESGVYSQKGWRGDEIKMTLLLKHQRNGTQTKPIKFLPSVMSARMRPFEHCRSPCASQTEPRSCSGGLKICPLYSRLHPYLDHRPQQHVWNPTAWVERGNLQDYIFFKNNNYWTNNILDRSQLSSKLCYRLHWI
jgi:hypothetical protein